MNRSIELSELLGIKPRITYWDNKSDTEIFSVAALEMIPPERIYTKDIYPDLTKPSNFVKLLDLLNAYLDIRCDCLMAVVPQIIDKAIFLASTNSSRFIDKKDKFKKQARATKWDY